MRKITLLQTRPAARRGAFTASHPCRLLPTAAFILAAGAAATMAADAPANSGDGAAGLEAAASTAPVAAVPDLGQALRSVFDESRVRRRELQAAAKAATDPARAAELRAQTEDEMRGLRRRLLEVQLEYAQRAGNSALAAELAGIISRLDRPAIATPQYHPAPAEAPAASQPEPAPAAR